MPAKAGIQAVGDNNSLKDLDSCLRRNDGFFPPSRSVSKGRVDFSKTFSKG